MLKLDDLTVILIIVATVALMGRYLYLDNKRHSFHQDEQVEIIDIPEDRSWFYEGCSVFYIAEHLTQHDNMVFLLLKDCDVMKRDPNVENPMTDTVSMKNIRKLH